MLILYNQIARKCVVKFQGGISMERIFMNAKEVQEFLEVSRTTAYQIINEMNGELVELGYRVQRGKINRQYFLDKYCYQERKEA